MINTKGMSRDFLVKLTNAYYWHSMRCKMNDYVNEYGDARKRFEYLSSLLDSSNALDELAAESQRLGFY